VAAADRAAAPYGGGPRVATEDDEDDNEDDEEEEADKGAKAEGTSKKSSPMSVSMPFALAAALVLLVVAPVRA